MTLRSIIESDRDSLTGDLGVDAVYRPAAGQSGDGFVVWVKLSSEPERLQPLKAGPMSAASRTHDVRTLRLMVPRVKSDEAVADGSPVGADGGVVQLRVGDTFAVAASELGDPGDGTRILRVAGDVYRPTGAAWWHCRVQP